VGKAIRDVGARLVFLPKYSPDLNPIEQVFAKFTTRLACQTLRSLQQTGCCLEFLISAPLRMSACVIKLIGLTEVLRPPSD